MQNRKKIFVTILLILSMTVMAGCSATVKADISEYADEEIVITGIAEEDIIVTPADLAEMDCVKKTVKGLSKGTEITVTGIGPTLETVLAEYDIEQSSVKQVIFIAYDGYSKSYDSDFFLVHPDIILSVSTADEPLYDENQPVRLLIPDTTADNWVKGVKKIQIIL